MGSRNLQVSRGALSQGYQLKLTNEARSLLASQLPHNSTG